MNKFWIFLDFIEFFNGKYHAGCVSVVRVQLLDGPFHEDIGYCSTECAMKGQAIYNVRTVNNYSPIFVFGCFSRKCSYTCNYCTQVSVTNALKKALSCFGNSVIDAIDKLLHENTSVVQKSAQLKNPLPIFKVESSNILDFPGELTMYKNITWQMT